MLEGNAAASVGKRARCTNCRPHQLKGMLYLMLRLRVVVRDCVVGTQLTAAWTPRHQAAAKRRGNYCCELDMALSTLAVCGKEVRPADPLTSMKSFPSARFFTATKGRQGA